MATLENFEIADMNRFIAEFLSQYEYHPKPLVVEKPTSPAAFWSITIPGHSKGVPLQGIWKRSFYKSITIQLNNHIGNTKVDISVIPRKAPEMWFLFFLFCVASIVYPGLLFIILIIGPTGWALSRYTTTLWKKHVVQKICRELEDAQRKSSMIGRQSNTPMRNQQEAKRWLPSESGTTIGTIGSENGKIILDEEHTEGARITLEKDGHAPWGITCGMYGYFCHTAFASSEEEALAKYESMKLDIVDILQECEEQRQIELIDNFVGVH